MRGLWLDDSGLVLRDDLPPPQLAVGEALVQVRLAGICGTDLAMMRGYAGFTGIPGHEFVGVIREAPAQAGRAGQRVVADINVSCGDCSECAAGRAKHCLTREVLGIRGRHGAFAEYLALPLRNLFPVPDTIPDEVAVFAEPLAAALRLRQQLGHLTGRRVLVLGAGRLGQLIARVLASDGVNLMVAARYPAQRQRLAAAGVDAIEPQDLVPAQEDIVVDATGSVDGLALAMKMVRPQGVVAVKSSCSEATAFDPAALVVNELTLIGSRCGRLTDALALLGSGALQTSDLIDARYPLAEGVAAFEHAARPGAMKTLIAPEL